MANRHLLAVNKLEDFKSWLVKNGWQIEQVKGKYEVLRARKETEKLPLIVYKTDKQGLVHLSVSDWNAQFVNQYLNKQNSSTIDKDKLSDYPYKNEPIEELYNYIKRAFISLERTPENEKHFNFMVDSRCEEHKARIRDIENQIMYIQKIEQQLEHIKDELELTNAGYDFIYEQGGQTIKELSEELKNNNKQFYEKIVKFINELAWRDIKYNAFQSTMGEFSGSTSAIPRYAKKYLDLWQEMFQEDLIQQVQKGNNNVKP